MAHLMDLSLELGGVALGSLSLQRLGTAGGRSLLGGLGTHFSVCVGWSLSPHLGIVAAFFVTLFLNRESSYGSYISC
jgi:hypothetical protein